MSMRESTFLVLTALTGEPLHGYAVIRAADALAGAAGTLRPSTLYAILDRLTDDGFVVVDREEAVDGRLRRYYRLTDVGADALGAEVERRRATTEESARRLRVRATRLAGGTA
jgi:DNA-binding PadR family transcriptional regulator